MEYSGPKHKLEVTLPSEREIVMTRVLDAPARLVFDAFTKPELIRRWLLGPDGFSMSVCDVDLRVGGKFHYVWRKDDGGREFGINGTYREIAPPARIVHGENFDEPFYPGEAQVTTAFAEKGGATTVTMTMAFDTREIRDGAIESGMESGIVASYDRLERILQEG
ncbi:MAG TPA: SRPBCC family protein [Candidatus Cybelea sp.]|jgi:uncharacterized protein YndB with AHSA1/START domain|nr:SRPBCC family protein [Candidatus Cybelea sp.]